MCDVEHTFPSVKSRVGWSLTSEAREKARAAGVLYNIATSHLKAGDIAEFLLKLRGSYNDYEEARFGFIRGRQQGGQK